jgi:hypothetical protein
MGVWFCIIRRFGEAMYSDSVTAGMHSCGCRRVNIISSFVTIFHSKSQGCCWSLAENAKLKQRARLNIPAVRGNNRWGCPLITSPFPMQCYGNLLSLCLTLQGSITLQSSFPPASLSRTLQRLLYTQLTFNIDQHHNKPRIIHIQHRTMTGHAFPHLESRNNGRPHQSITSRHDQ